MKIACDFDSGSIEVLSAAPDRVRLSIRRDTNAQFRQWFHFRIDGATELRGPIVIEGADEATYAGGWEFYRAFGSYDGESWFRVDTGFDGRRLTLHHKPDRPQVWYAYFVPYSLKRHERLVRDAACKSHVRHEVLGSTIQGRPIDLLVFGDRAAKRSLWFTCRQHAGETMAEWFAEGLVERLVDAQDPLVAALLERACCYVVPNMNPDGSVLGNLRANAAGENLNRAWLDPNPTTSPEVLCVRRAMIDAGVDLLIDAHGDEQHRYCFVVGAEGNPGYSPRLAALERAFVSALLRETADFQDSFRYARDKPGEGDLSIGNNWVGQRFDCLSLVLEMPFKDLVDDLHDDDWGWTPNRSKALAHATLRTLPALLDRLR